MTSNGLFSFASYPVFDHADVYNNDEIMYIYIYVYI